jgi:ATP-dependent exoDNAse (exonuclease V) beta subunit
VGLTWSDLHALAHSDSSSTVSELLDDSERLAALSETGRQAVERARPFLDRMLAPRRSSSLRQRVEECWIALGGPGALRDKTEVDNVYRFLDLLDTHERGGTLPDVAALESVLDDEKVSSSDRSRVQVMTMHRAKGLEFDHVMLYGLGRKPGGGGAGVLSWFDFPSPHGDERKIISPIGSRADVERDPVHRYISVVDAEKDAHEQGRLLYVACTRAQKTLHIVGNVSVSRDGSEYRSARSDSLLHLLWPAVEEEYARAFDGWTCNDGGGDHDVFIEPVRKVFATPWKLPQIEPLPGSLMPLDATDTDEEVEFYWVGTDARIAGTIVHRWLQVLAEGRGSLDDGEVEAERKVTKRWLREMGLGEDMQGGIIERVEAALDGIRRDKKGRWILEGDGHAEFALTGLVDGNIESVVLDRIRIDEHGIHWIVDYKTSTHEGGNLQGFLNAEVERYKPQLDKYAAIYGAFAKTRPRCALYFPLLQEFVEV